MSLRPWLSGFRARLHHQRTRRGSRRRSGGATVSEQLEQRTLLTATALVVGTELTVLTDAAEDVTIQANPTSGRAEVLIDGQVLESGSTVPAGSLTSLTIVTGSGDNQIDLSAVTSSVFTSLTTIEVDSGDGEDVIIGAADLPSSLSGGDGNDVITGGSGAEVIRGGDGQDTIDGGDGNDDINAGDGDDSVVGGAGDDTITADDGEDIVFGGAGNDSVLANNGADTVFGEAGDDTLNGDGGFDSIDGGTGNDVIFAGAADDTVSGGDGNDTILGQGGNDSIMGDAGDDMLSGQSGRDTMDGGDGNDTVNGNSGNDNIDGGAGDDNVYGGSGDDQLQGSDGFDTLKGNGGNDTIFGGAGADCIHGDAGDDLVFGGQAQVDITPAVTLNAEGNTGSQLVSFTVTRTTDIGGSASVDFATMNGSAVAGQDYTATTGTITFASGELSRVVQIPVLGDNLVEGNETFSVVLSNAQNLSIGVSTGIATIVDDDVAGLSINDVTVDPEGTAGTTTTAMLSISLSNPSVVPVTVNFATADGTATAGADYVATSGSVTFPANSTAPQTVTVTVNGDNDTETNETFDVVLSGAVNGTITDGTGTVTINDDDGGSFSIDNQTFSEVTQSDIIFAIDISGSATGTFPNGMVGDVNNDGRANTVIDVELASIINYVNTTLAVNFPTTRISIITFFDNTFGVGRVEMDPAAGYVPFTNNLSTTAGADVNNNGMNDVEEILRSIQARTLPSSGQDIIGTANQTFTTLATPNGEGLLAVLSDFAIGNATAASRTAAINAGRTIRAFEVDAGVNQPAPGTPPSNTALSYDPNAIRVLNSSDLDMELGTLVTGQPFTVTLSQALAQTVTVDYATMNGTAIAGQDYVAQNGTLTFAPGVTTQQITIQILDDAVSEPTETFTVVLSNPSGGTMIGTAVGTGTILDDDGGGNVSANSSATGEETPEDIQPANQKAAVVYVPQAASNGTASGPEDDTIFGGTGNDTLIASSGNDSINGGGGNDSIDGGGGNDSVLGGAGMDTINGQGGDDTLNGQGGADSIDGGDGEDDIIFEGDGNGDDTVSGGNGADRVIFNTGSTDDTVSVGQNADGQFTLTENGSQITIDSTVSVVEVNTQGGDDTITVGDVSRVPLSFLQIDGGSGADTIDASGLNPGRVVVHLRGGEDNDTITGGAFGDRIFGDAGDDSVDSGAGNDSVQGGDGADVINLQDGDDTADGGAGADSITGGMGNDSILGGLDGDTLVGNEGADTLRGGFGNDNLNGNSGDDSLDGSFGRDSISGGSGNDLIDGGRDSDLINGHSGNDTIRGDHGDDTLNGQDGDDEIVGGDGNDNIMGGAGRDGLAGGDGDDLIQGQGGSDTIRGNDGNDTIRGGGSNDTLLGDQGDDTIDGDSGTDTAAGGEGANNFLDVEIIDESFMLTPFQMSKLDGV